MGPFIELIRSWNDTTQNNPHISEGKIQVQGIGMYDDKTLKKKILGMDGFGGQQVIIDFDSGRIIVVHSLDGHYNWKKIVHKKLKQKK